jgi:flagellar motor switch protein FliG
MASEGDPKIRRIAIVLQSMDADTVRKLLSQFPEDVSRAIRRAFSSLGTVTPAERAAAAQELQSLFGKPANTSPDIAPAVQVLDHGRKIQDTVQLSPEARNSASDYPSSVSASLGTTSTSDPNSKSGLRSWLSVPPATLAEILQGERPSVVAAVLHELPVVMATSVLQLLPIPSASEAMAAMPHLHRNDPSFMNEILDQIWSKSEDELRNSQKTHLGMEKLRAILAQAPEDHKYLWTAALGNIDPKLPSALGWGRSSSGSDPSAMMPTPTPPTLKLYTPPEPEQPSVPSPPSTIAPTPETQTRDSPVKAPYQSIQDLMKLADADFVSVIYSVEPATVLLALAGVERDFLKRVERMMPKKDLYRFRQRLNRLNDVTLRQIDQAHFEILERANTLFSQGQIDSQSQDDSKGRLSNTNSFSEAA